MLNIRQGTFETNSSSTHSLVISENRDEEYIPLAKHIKIEWIDTNDYYFLDSLTQKVSYLVSQIANKLKYACNTYEELLDEVKENYEFQTIEKYLKETFKKEIRFPDNKNGIYDDIEYIIEINHQLIPWSGMPAEDTLNDLISCMEDKEGNIIKKDVEELSFAQKLDIYLKNGNYISFGRD